jgi:hypothetical protein
MQDESLYTAEFPDINALFDDSNPSDQCMRMIVV